MKITVTLPDEVAERVRQLPDRDEFVTRAVEAALADSPPSPPVEAKPSRWAQLVERIESQSFSLGSYAKKFDADRKEFRQNLRFPHDER
jgi:Arc/MetJ-type ribon-helix-helix transcriptional regulator